ncbi:MAG: RhuM family protein [Candidatus Moraniibacteriota bacterium]
MKNRQSNNSILIYESEDGKPKIEVRIEDETVWLSQEQIAELFNKGRSTVAEHILNVFKEGELDEKVACREFRRTTKHGAIKGKTQEIPVKHYNLDVIISVGYRVKSLQGTKFRQWATVRIREYLVQGFTMNDEFLKNNGGGVYFKKLLARIRDIRSSEKMLYRQVLDLYATSADYDPKSLHSIKFFKIVQNKLHYATHKQTAAEVIFNRADSEKEFMGLTVFAGDLPVLEEVRIAKNYLTAKELEKLNRLVSAYFELAELRAMNRQKMNMESHIKALDSLLGDYGEGVLVGSGEISHKKAMEKAEKEYRKYQVRTLSSAERDYLKSINKIEKKIKHKKK